MDNHKFVITIYANMKRLKGKFCCWFQLIVPGQLCILVQVHKRGQVILKSGNTVSDHGLPVNLSSCYHHVCDAFILFPKTWLCMYVPSTFPSHEIGFFPCVTNMHKSGKSTGVAHSKCIESQLVACGIQHKSGPSSCNTLPD